MNKVLSAVTKPFKALIGLIVATQLLIKGIDVSAYQINVPWAILVQYMGLCFAIIKGDQATATANHIALARAAGVPIVGEYFWNDPTVTVAQQLAWFIADIKANNPDMVFLDIEQYWAHWDQYWEYLQGKRTLANVEKIGPQAIADNALGVLKGLKAAFPNLYIGAYCATWFTTYYSPPLVIALKGWPLWWANWISNKIMAVTWEQLAASPPASYAVDIPAGFVWDFWQWVTTYITPAKNERWDMDVFKGDLAALYKKIGKQPPIVPPTDFTIEEKVQWLWDNHPDHPQFIPFSIFSAV